MTTEQLERHIQSASIPAVNSTEIVKAEDGSELVLAEFSSATFTGVDSSDDIGLLSSVEGNAVNFSSSFSIPDNGPSPIVMISWLQAHSQVPFGRYSIDPQSGDMRVTGQLPLFAAKSGSDLIEWGLRRVIHTFYVGEINVKANTSIRSAVDDGIITDEEASRKIEQFAEEAHKLIGLSDEDPSDSSNEFAKSSI